MSDEIQVGSEGLSEVKYVGGNVGTNVFIGCFTGQRYVAGGLKEVIFVDDRDLYGTPKVPGILELEREGKRLFELTGETSESAEVVVTEEDEELMTDFSAMTVSEIKKYKFENNEEIYEALIQEEAGKNRSTVIDFLQSILE